MGVGIEEIPLNSWEEFEKFIEDQQKWVRLQKNKNEYGYFSDLLFRGQADANWGLETTLDRYAADEEFSFESYNHLLYSIHTATASYTDHKYEWDEKVSKGTLAVPPSYAFMVYVRHHGFPSPLLDWTVSPYIAAFFAYRENQQADRISIYCYREYVGGGKSGFTGNSQITGLGPYMKTHKRHHFQQCQYTICTYIKDQKNYYSSYDDIEFSANQDSLKKITLPSGERDKILSKLYTMNINAYSLFNNEDALMEMLAFKEITLKKEER